MQAKGCGGAHAVKHAACHLHGLVKRAVPAGRHVQRQIVPCQQHVARMVAEGLQVQRGAHGKCLRTADRVNAAEKAANPFQHVGVVQLGPAPAAAGADAETEARKVVQRPAVQHHRPDDRNFSRHQLGRKGVFFFNLRVCPAVGPVKLGHHGVAGGMARAFQPHLVDTVFVA